MGANFMALVCNSLNDVGKGLNRVSRDEETRPKLEFPEQVQQPNVADLACEHAALDVGGGIAASIRADLPGHRIDVSSKCAQDFLGHFSPPSF
jgi:hypothetical protein